MLPSRLAFAAAGMSILLLCPAAYGYSVLTHEAVVDSTWDSAIKPLLLKRFPAATADELTAAHAYAYGGEELFYDGALAFLDYASGLQVFDGEAEGDHRARDGGSARAAVGFYHVAVYGYRALA